MAPGRSLAKIARLAALGSLGLLAACATPLESCLSEATRALRPVDREIAEVEGNLARGYAIERIEVFETRFVPCGFDRGNVLTDGVDPNVRPSDRSFCFEDFSRIVEQPRPIVVSAERARLAALRVERDRLAREAAPRVAECRARFPEG